MAFSRENHLTITGHSRTGRSFDWSIRAGEQFRIRGSNGCGKTTLLKAIAGLGTFDERLIPKRYWNSRLVNDPDLSYFADMHYLGHRVGLDEMLSIEEEWQFWYRLETKASLSSKKISGISEKLGLTVSVDQYIVHLSAGERQKVALARLLLCPKPLWILDEPDSHLDTGSQNRLQDWYAEHRQDGGIILEASHREKAEDDENIWRYA